VSRGGKSRRVPDFGDEDCRHDWADTFDRLDRFVALVSTKPLCKRLLDHDAFGAVELEKVPERVHPDGVRALEGHLVKQLLTSGAEHVIQGRQDAVLGHHRVDLGLGRGAKGCEF